MTKLGGQPLKLHQTIDVPVNGEAVPVTFVDENGNIEPLATINESGIKLIQDPIVNANAVPIIVNGVAYNGTPSTTPIDLSSYGTGKAAIVYCQMAELSGAGSFTPYLSPFGFTGVIDLPLYCAANQILIRTLIVPLVNNKLEYGLLGTSTNSLFTVALIGFL